jgi:Phage capsid family/Phage integrase family
VSLTDGATASYVRENELIQVSEQEFAQAPLLRPKQLAALVPVSNRLLRDAAEAPDAEAVIREDLAEVLALAGDLAFLTGSGRVLLMVFGRTSILDACHARSVWATVGAGCVEAAGKNLALPYRFALLVLDATGARVGELEAARIADLDLDLRAWLVRKEVSKTGRPRWVQLPDDLYEILIERLPPPDLREPDAPLFREVTADRLRTAIGRACRAAGVPPFGPHQLATAESHFGTDRECRGQTSAHASGNARSPSLPTPTPTHS